MLLAGWQVTIYQVPLFVIGAIAVVLAASVWHQRGKPGAVATAVMMTCLAIWSLAYGVELGSSDLGIRLILTKVQYIGISLVPLAWYLFARQFSVGRTHLSRTQVALFLIVPLITIALAWTNPSHGLMSHGETLVGSGPVWRIQKTYGPWFWVHTAYSYLLLALGSYRLITTMLSKRNIYRAQTVWVILAALVPWIANGLYLALPLHAFPIDPTPVFFAVPCFALFWCIFHLHMFDLVPAAYASVIDSMPEGLIVLDDQDRIIAMNPAAEEMTGCPATDVVGRTLTELPDYPSEIADWLGSPLSPRARQIAPLSSQPGRRYAWQRSPLLDDAPRAGYMLLLRDITEDERARQDLLRRVAQMEALCNALDVGVIVQGDDGVVQLANRCLCDMFALPPLKGMEAADWSALSERSRHQLLGSLEQIEANMLRQLDLAGAATTQELELVDGRRITCDVVPIDVSDGGGGQVWLYRDVTARRRYEERLSHIQKMEAMARLAGGVAHDFNNLLTGILGYVDLLTSEPDLPVRFHDDLDMIREQGERGAALVRQILDYSRRSSSEMQPLELDLLIRDVLAFLQQMLPESVVLSYRPALGDQSFSVRGDATQLQQMLTNLAINASDAMPAGGDIEIGLRHVICHDASECPLPDMPPGHWIALSFHDSGTGIAPDHIDRIFDPFFTTKEVGKGTGLGLAQVYGIVKQHGGHVRVESVLGQGALFEVFLPPAEQNDGSQPRPAPEAPRSDQLHQATILVIDDDAMVRRICRRTCQRMGHRVIVADDGREGLSLALDNLDVLDVLLCDVVMPKLSGPEVVAALAEQRPDMACVLMSGYDVLQAETEAIQHTRLAHLQKPFSIQALTDAINDALSPRD